MNKKYVAIDLGATSGRVVTGKFDGEKVTLFEENRFINNPVNILGTVYWDMLFIYQSVLDGLNKANRNGDIDSIGIDSWGSDFALFDRSGKMLENPIHYRDDMSKGMPAQLYKIVSDDDVYIKTGIQHMRLNGIYRLFSMAKNGYIPYKSAHSLLMIPDVLTYFLTGKMINEFTNATTTQMVDAKTGDWAYDMLKKLGINTQLFRKPSIVGKTQIDILDSVIDTKAKLSVVGSHDTASAVAAVPSTETDFIYISSGTWSLVGTETEKPIINKKSLHNNFTNEGGICDKNRFLKNVMGMWILEELRRGWKADGMDLDYTEIINQTKLANAYQRIIDPDSIEFMDIGDMAQKINDFLVRTGQKPAETVGEFARCLFDSLALKYKYVIEKITEMTGKTYNTVHIVGGGCKNGLLNQITADVCEMTVVAGPDEATAAGNILTQGIACRDISGLDELRKIVKNSFDLKTFTPKVSVHTKQAYIKLINILKI